MKSLKDFLVDDRYIDDDGCSHEDATDLLQSGILKFCGCGAPEENLKYILGGIELIADDKATYEDRVWYHGSEMATDFFDYVIDKKEITDHGCSVRHAFLTDHGKQVLSLLREWRDAQPKASP